MTSVSFAAHESHWGGSNHLHSQSSACSSGQSLLSGSGPSPNPNFSFPNRPQHDQLSGSPRQIKRRSAAALPAFSFPLAPEDPSSSTKTPSPVEVSSNNPGDWFRFPNASPNASNEMLSVHPDAISRPHPPSLPPPPGSLNPPPPGRGARRHAHRRSAAISISSVDLGAVAKAFPPVPVGGSAPSTPKLPFANDDPAKLSSRSFPDMQLTQTPPLTPLLLTDLKNGSSTEESTLPSHSFHRPLSTISSESSVSTVRPNQYPSEKPGLKSGAVTPIDETSSRPKTAGPSLVQWAESKIIPREDKETKRPVSASASVALSPKFTEISTSSHENISGKDDNDNSRDPAINDDNNVLQRTTSINKPKKQKKMRPWAGILTRKGKKRSSKKAKKSPTPPMLSRTNSELGSIYSVNFDEDNTIVIRTPTASQHPQHSLAHGNSDTFDLDAAWKPKSFYEQQIDSDVFSPVIDLDAALGPFNTPEMGSERNTASGFSVASKRMYSGGRRGEFVGPEMRYHRRTESAPEMPQFDRNALGRFGLATAMANPDVFDEEEEDAFLAQNEKPTTASNSTEPNFPPRVDSKLPVSKTIDNPSQISLHESIEGGSPTEANGLGIQIVDSASVLDIDESATAPLVENRPSTAQALTPVTPSANIVELAEKQHEATNLQHPIDIVDFEQYATRDVEKPSNSAQPSPRNFEDKRPSTSPEFAFPLSKVGLATSGVPLMVPSFPSPAPSNLSFDVPRLGTASSSITDRQTNSIYSVGPGSDYFQGSVEDVPSLTSSASTMTGTLPRQSGNGTIYPRAPCDRSSSFSTAPPFSSSRPSSSSTKRASLVSFSKLVGATSERSKLSQEEKAPTDEPEKRRKKGNRISRLMHFWKTKEKEKQQRDGSKHPKA